MGRLRNFLLQLRYYPRNLYLMLRQIDDGVARLNEQQALLALPPPAVAVTPCDDLQEFCNDATAALLAMQRTAETTAAQVETLSRVLRAGLPARRTPLADGGPVPEPAAPGPAAGSEILHLELQRQGRLIAALARAVAQQTAVFPSAIWTPESGERARAILALLRPYAAAGLSKVRVGRDFDGGYVMLDAFAGHAAALSLGIDEDVSWDTAIADRGIRVLQYDPTVPGAPATHPLFQFEPLRIAPQDGDGRVSLATILRTRLGEERAPLLLKIDIEGAEWDVLAGLGVEAQARFSQIVCEFHDLDRLGERGFGDTARRVFEALDATHFVCHVHGNNCANFANVGNVIVPQSLEVTFASRALADAVATDETFPTALDFPNEPRRADLYLGRFRFDSAPAAPDAAPTDREFAASPGAAP